MATIAENISKLKREIPEDVKIIAVSKTMPASLIKEAYDAGHRAFGENKVQELNQKHPVMPEDTEWHLIGHLQTNKVKYIVPFVSLIHSVDSLHLLSEINRQAAKIGKTIDCLLQIHIATEETKFGLSFSEAMQLTESKEFNNLKNINIRGLMGMATFTNDFKVVKNEFIRLKDHFDELKSKQFRKSEFFTELSMGMSNDYKIAIEAGSTMVRIGSLIFGERNYNG